MPRGPMLLLTMYPEAMTSTRSNMDHSPLRSGPLIMRPTTAEDVAFVRRVESDPANARDVDQWSEAEHQSALEDPDFVHLILETAREHEPVGYLILEDARNPQGSLLLRRVAIARKGRGFGRAAVRLAIRYCFEVLGFERLWLTVAPDNRRARRLYEHLGFADRGRYCDPESGRPAEPPMLCMVRETAPES